MQGSGGRLQRVPLEVVEILKVGDDLGGGERRAKAVRGGGEGGERAQRGAREDERAVKACGEISMRRTRRIEQACQDIDRAGASGRT